MNIIHTKIAPLAERENNFYLTLARSNTEIETYTVNIYRNRMLTATAEQKAFEHFVFDSANSITSGNINVEGSFVIKVYYTRNSYVTTIGNYAFQYCYNLTDVYYTGGKSEWRNISIDSYNGKLINANIHYNYIPENTFF